MKHREMTEWPFLIFFINQLFSKDRSKPNVSIKFNFCNYPNFADSFFIHDFIKNH